MVILNYIIQKYQTGDAENIVLFLCRKRQEYFEAGKSCGAVEPPTASDTARQSRSGVVLFYENGAFYGAVNAQKQKIQEFNRVLKTVQDKKGDIMSKKHISIWIDEKNLKECEANIQLTKCRSRGEYIEKAVEFYNGYLHDKNNEAYVNKNVVNTLQGMMNSFEKRMARQMFKQAVETAKVFWLVVRGLNINPEDVNDLHLDCVEEVKTINGAIRFPYKSREDDE